jgi:hypothetical protein
MDILKVERTSSYLGMKNQRSLEMLTLTGAISTTILQSTMWKLIKTKGKRRRATQRKAVSSGDQKKYDDPDKEEHIKERKEIFEKSLKEELDVDKYDNFELVQDGRYGDTAMLKFRETFSLKKLISKAGKNYIFEIGKLIGDQIKLEQDELAARKVDIWIPHAKTIEKRYGDQYSSRLHRGWFTGTEYEYR